MPGVTPFIPVMSLRSGFMTSFGQMVPFIISAK